MRLVGAPEKLQRTQRNSAEPNKAWQKLAHAAVFASGATTNSAFTGSSTATTSSGFTGWAGFAGSVAFGSALATLGSLDTAVNGAAANGTVIKDSVADAVWDGAGPGGVEFSASFTEVRS